MWKPGCAACMIRVSMCKDQVLHLFGMEAVACDLVEDRIDVHPRTGIAQELDHSLIGQRLHRKTDKVIAPSERFVKKGEVTFQGRRGIDIERRADGCRNLGHGHVLGVQHTVTIEKMIHCSRPSPKPKWDIAESRKRPTLFRVYPFRPRR